MEEFIRYCGFALILGGALLIAINVFLTPSYIASFKQGEAAARISKIHLIRISAAIVDSLLLLFGSIGLYLVQKGAPSLFGTFAFFTTFIGTSLLVAIEWSNLFVLRAVAQTNPETLDSLDKSKLMNIGFASGIGLFMLGWLLFPINLLQANIVSRWSSISTLIGVFLIPALGASPLRVTGQVLGNVVFGLGIIGMGYSII